MTAGLATAPEVGAASEDVLRAAHRMGPPPGFRPTHFGTGGDRSLSIAGCAVLDPPRRGRRASAFRRQQPAGNPGPATRRRGLPPPQRAHPVRPELRLPTLRHRLEPPDVGVTRHREPRGAGPEVRLDRPGHPAPQRLRSGAAVDDLGVAGREAIDPRHQRPGLATEDGDRPGDRVDADPAMLGVGEEVVDLLSDRGRSRGSAAWPARGTRSTCPRRRAAPRSSGPFRDRRGTCRGRARRVLQFQAQVAPDDRPSDQVVVGRLVVHDNHQ